MTVAPHALIAWLGLGGAALSDIATGRIPNWLTGSMMALGIGTHVIQGTDPWLGVIGCAAAFAIHFVLYALGVVKAGDAKLMMGLGACVGWLTMVEATLWWLILNIPVGIVILAARGRLSNLAAVARHKLAEARGMPTDEPPELTVEITGPLIAVCGGLAMLTDWLEGLL